MLEITELSGFSDEPPVSLSVVSTLYISTDASFVAPADIQKGDLLLLTCIGWNGISGTVPTGFTQYDEQSNTLAAFGMIRAAYKVADGTEGGTTITGYLQASGGDAAYFLVARPSRLGGQVATMTTPWQRTDGDPADVNFVYPQSADPTIVIAIVRDATVTHSGIWSQTPAEDGQIATGTTRGYYRVKRLGDSGGMLTMADKGTDNILWTASVTLKT